MKVQTRRGNNLVSIVDELINLVDASWDVDLVRSIFEPIDANSILQIPITTGREDYLALHYNRNSLLSVKSAYHGQWNKKFGARLDTIQGSGTSNRQMWRNLWKLQVLGKIKIFGWRDLHGLTPCKSILANGHIIPEGGCPVCRNGAEDIEHFIFTCDRARAVWRSIGVSEKIKHLPEADRSGSTVLEEVLHRGEQIQGPDLGLAELILTGG